MSCSKTFIVKVGPPYYAYFKCDEAAPITVLNNAIDSFHLTANAADNPSVAGKIGTAILGDGSDRNYQGATVSHWALTGSFSVRFWIYPVDNPFDEAVIYILNQFTISKFRDSGNALIDFSVNGDDFSTVSVTSLPLTLNAWNHVVCRFDTGVEIGVKVNDGADQTTPALFAIKPQATTYLWVGISNLQTNHALDEIALWTRKITDAEITADWNSGAGVTYP